MIITISQFLKHKSMSIYINIWMDVTQVKVMKIQDELESGKRQRKPGMSIQKQVEQYRNKLLQKVSLGKLDLLK